MKDCISSGYPFVFGFSVYESFETDEVAKTGIMPMPQKNEKVLGGHAVSAVGFNDKYFINLYNVFFYYFKKRRFNFFEYLAF